MPELIKAVEDLGWLLPTPIQQESVPLILGGGDVMAAAETGSGKTGAFGLPLLQTVHELRMSAQAGAIAAASSVPSCGSSDTPKRPRVKVQLSEDDRDMLMAVDTEGVVCQCRDERKWAGVRGNLGAVSGKHYYEVVPSDEGLCRVGWATRAASLELGTDKHSFGYGGTGKKSHNRKFDDYGGVYGKGDVIGCCLDCDSNVISFFRNGESLGVAFELPRWVQGQAMYPAICIKNGELRVNFGDEPFRRTVPDGFTPLTRAAPTQTVGNFHLGGSTLAAAMKGRRPLALILEPTRDLAEQTHNFMQQFKKHLPSPGLRAELVVGGVDPKPVIKALAEGVDIVTGTPGKIMDLVETGKLPLDTVRFFVLDEADRLLDTGNQDTIMKLFQQFPKYKDASKVHRLQVLLFSATLHSPEVRSLASRICVNPILVDLKGKDAVPDTVDHVTITVDPTSDRTWLQSEPHVWTDGCHALLKLGPDSKSDEAMSEAIKRLKPRLLQRIIDRLDMDQAIVFCRTNHDCDNLENFLNNLSGSKGGCAGKRESGKEDRYSCCVLGGTRSMHERREALSAFKDGYVRFLIATDVAARGIDVSGLPYVINMTLPDRSEDYIHRIGRVGRADHLGLAISIVSSAKERVWFCTVKGLKPWLKPDGKNTKLTDQGGHTIWYDEGALLRDIDERLGVQKISEMGADLTLPHEIAQRIGSGPGGSAAAYGKERSDKSGEVLSAHLQAVAPAVERLAALEWDAQTSFLMLKQRWSSV